MKRVDTSGRNAMLIAVLGLLLPLIAACGAPNAGQPTTQPTAALPTAVVATPATNPTAEPATPTDTQNPTAAPATAVPDQPTVAPTADSGGRRQFVEFGVVSHLYYTDRERVLTLTNIAGFDWVRQQIVWKDVEGPAKDYKWGDLDNIVEDVAARNVKLLVNIVQAPSFYTADGKNGLPQNPQDMGDFVEALVKRYGTKIKAIEIWNEQNLAHENGGQVTIDDAGKYVEILIESYKRIKAIAPDITVLAGAPSSSGVDNPSQAVSDANYFRAMYTYKGGIIKDYFDAQGVHPGGAANPPDTLYPEKPSFIEGCQPAPDRCWNDDSTHYFRHIEEVRQFMVENGVGDKQIWITEYGWATPNNTPGYEFGNFVSLDQQRDYIIGAMQRVNNEYRDDQGKPWVGVMFLWNMNFAVLWGAQGNPDHEQASFGILNADWSPRPAFLAIQSYLAEVKQTR